MHKRIHCFFLLILIFIGNIYFSPTQVLAQRNVCNMQLEAIHQHSRFLINFDTLSAQQLASKYLAEQGTCKGIGFFLTIWNLIDKRDTVATTKKTDEYLRYLKEIQADSSLYANYYTIKARKYIFIDADYSEALSSQLNAMRILESQKDTSLYIQNLIWAGVTWYRMGDIKKMQSYRTKATHLLPLVADYPRKAEHLCILSSMYYIRKGSDEHTKGQLDTACFFGEMALEKAKLFKNSVAELDSYIALSAIASFRKNDVLALTYLDTALRRAQPFKHDKAIAGVYQNISIIYRKQGNFNLAARYADSAVPFFVRFASPSLLASGYSSQYQAYKGLGDYQEALMAFEASTKINDSLLSLEKTKKVNELELKYNQSINEQKILTLQNRQQMYLFLAIFLFMAIAVAVIMVRQKNLTQKQKILEAEQRLNRARMNPHFFFNALASLQQLAHEKTDNMELVSSLAKFSHIMRDTLESTYKEFIVLQDEMDFLQQYLSLQQMRLSHRFAFEIQANESIETDDIAIPPMIIQPFVENAIEHGLYENDRQGNLSIMFKQEEKHLIVIIDDNGTGLKEKTNSSQHISRAIQIIKDRIYLLNESLKTNASFSINNKLHEAGVQVKIILPLLHIHEVSVPSNAIS